jgi:hypothetical protein
LAMAGLGEALTLTFRSLDLRPANFNLEYVFSMASTLR